MSNPESNIKNQWKQVKAQPLVNLWENPARPGGHLRRMCLSWTSSCIKYLLKLQRGGTSSHSGYTQVQETLWTSCHTLIVLLHNTSQYNAWQHNTSPHLTTTLCHYWIVVTAITDQTNNIDLLSFDQLQKMLLHLINRSECCTVSFWPLGGALSRKAHLQHLSTVEQN